VEIRCGAQRIILDAGTGLRALGDQLLSEGEVKATLLLSHHHWDHIQGLPFFVPIYLPSTQLEVIGPAAERCSMHEVLEHQMQSPVFPVRLDQVPSRLVTRDVQPGESFAVGDCKVTAAKLNHPGGSMAYRIDHAGRSVVYATDTEHYSCVDPTLCKLAEGADVLIYDSQYTPAEYSGKSGPSKVGWGHSTFEAGAALASRAGVDKYLLFHHDPKRTDAEVFDLEHRARELFPESHAATEGLEIVLPQATGVAA
jgi:phosphoribosyl 1,2-cyclic phosphodiesterase